MSDQLVAETSTWQHTQHSQQTNIHAPGGIRTHNLSRQAAADLCLRLRLHWSQNWHNTANQHLSGHTLPDVWLHLIWHVCQDL